MKKIFSLMTAALVSLSMLSGTNDLLWDYTQEKIPTTGSDNGLYYSGYVNDAPSTNNGLNGVKLNSDGWAYFEKAAVAGKLKLTFANRKAQTAYAVSVYNGTKEDGATPMKGTKIADTKDIEFGASTTIDLPAEVKGVYIERKTGAEGVLSKIQFTEDVARTFVDFEMIMCNMTADYDFSSLPTGVTASGTFNTDQHGYRNFTITVPVDGTVRFSIGDCKYGNQPIVVKNSKNETITTLTYPAADCYKNDDSHKNSIFTYNYLGEADVLTFGPIQYCNYFKAEAAEITPCEIIFKDQTGKELGKVDSYEGATLEKIPYDVTDLTPFSKSEVFRGWFYANNKKAKVGDIINGNTIIQAHVTPFERATEGSIQTYNFASQTFYVEDHETIDTTGACYFHDGTHGWAFKNNDEIIVEVAGNACLVFTLCKEGKADAKWIVYDANDKKVGEIDAKASADGTETSCNYTGEAGKLRIVLSSTGENYLHKLTVYNVLDFPKKDEQTGYYIVPANDVASFLMCLTQAQEGDKIFLPNGTYDLGQTVLTTISKNNIAIIGQSMTGTIIKNAPDVSTESIDKTATIKINKNVTGTYLQDLTIQNSLDYYKNDNGRAVALWDQGTKTVCKNVRLLSYQDTYYSNLVGAVKYFEDCEIHGTVDFICGDGSVYFSGTELVCEQRKKDGGGSDALTASNADASDRGYVFDHCTVRYAENIQGTKPVVSFGRSWNNSPKCVFLYTFLDDSNGELVMTKDAGAQKDKIARWTLGAMNALPTLFGEYKSVNKEGQVISPESNNVTFVLGSNEKQMETILTDNQAAQFTMEYTLGDWSATAAADAKQAECEKEGKDFEPNAIYLAEAEGELPIIFKGSEFWDKIALYNGITYTIRKANARGGFGPQAGEESQATYLPSGTNEKNTKKIIRNGQLIIIRDGNEYNVLGAQL